MATKTIPQLTALAAPLTSAALFEISQAGSFKITLDTVTNFVWGNIPPGANAPSGLVINCGSTFELDCSAAINIIAAQGMTLEAGVDIVITSDGGGIQISSAGNIEIKTNGFTVILGGVGGGDVALRPDGGVTIAPTGGMVSIDTTANDADVGFATGAGNITVDGLAGLTQTVTVAGVGDMVFLKGFLVNII